MSLKAIWAGNTAYSKFLLSVGIILMSAVIFTLLSAVLASGIYGVSMLELQSLLNNFSDPRAISILKFLQTVSTIGTFIIPAFLIAFLFNEKPLNYLSLSGRVSSFSIILVVLALIAALPLINYLGELNSRMSLPSFLSGMEKWMKESEDKAAELTKNFLEMHSTSDLLFNIFMIALLPALGEELLFRGIIQRIFSEWSKNIHIGVWTSAVLFSTMHMQFYGFIPRMLLGALLGYLLVWSGSLWLPIIAHFVNNASAVLFTYLFNEKIISVDPDKIGMEGEQASVLISVILFATLLWLIYKKEKGRSKSLMESS
ncbi:MAG: CPBP family intramembrane metalloprotease [Bacteroidetes bacterium]|nr:CPBP family intramembrane metalloprotease [Bacteroidota bacterium]